MERSAPGAMCCSTNAAVVVVVIIIIIIIIIITFKRAKSILYVGPIFTLTIRSAVAFSGTLMIAQWSLMRLSIQNTLPSALIAQINSNVRCAVPSKEAWKMGTWAYCVKTWASESVDGLSADVRAGKKW